MTRCVKSTAEKILKDLKEGKKFVYVKKFLNQYHFIVVYKDKDKYKIETRQVSLSEPYLREEDVNGVLKIINECIGNVKKNISNYWIVDKEKDLIFCIEKI